MTERQKEIEQNILDFLIRADEKTDEYRTVLVNYKNWRSVIEQQEAAEAQRAMQIQKLEIEKAKTEAEIELREREFEFNKAKAEAEIDLEAERNALKLKEIEATADSNAKDRWFNLLGGAAIFAAGIASTAQITKKTEDSILPRESMSERTEMMRAIAKKLFKK